jgi:hypothetical protein
MRMLLVLTALSPFLLASNYAPAYATQTKVHKKVYQLNANWTARYDKAKSVPSDAAVSNSEYEGLINGVTPGPARWPGDTHSN